MALSKEAFPISVFFVVFVVPPSLAALNTSARGSLACAVVVSSFSIEIELSSVHCTSLICQWLKGKRRGVVLRGVSGRV